ADGVWANAPQASSAAADKTPRTWPANPLRMTPSGDSRPKRLSLHRMPDRPGLRNWRVMRDAINLPNLAGVGGGHRRDRAETCVGTSGPVGLLDSSKSLSC